MSKLNKLVTELFKNESLKTAFVLECNNLNYYGKRVRHSQFGVVLKAMQVCPDLERIIYDLAVKMQLDKIPQHDKNAVYTDFTEYTNNFLVAVCAWLEDNRPPAAIKEKKAKVAREDLPVFGGSLRPAQDKWAVKSGKTFILSSAQNNTSVNRPFLKALETYAEHLGAELIISKFAYNVKGYANPTVDSDGLWYAPELSPYLLEENIFLGDEKKAAFLGALCISPTAINPLTGIEAIVGNHHAIIPCAKYQMHNIAALKGELVRELSTTGVVTHRNYIQRLAGQKAEALHCYGATLVEFNEEGIPFIRHLNCMGEDGSFYDLDVFVTPEQVYQANDHVTALQFGDLHAEKLDVVVADCSWGAGINGFPSLIDALKPKFTICHDSHDFTSRNHHNRKDYDFLAERYFLGQESVLEDILDTASVFNDIMRPFSEIVVVESNHDLALANWLKAWDVNIGLDPANAILYHELNLDKYRHIEKFKSSSNWNALEVAMKKIANLEDADKINFLQVDESYKLSGVEMGCHGHIGANGSRGNPKQFAKLGRLNTGHTHTASVNGLCYTAGVSGKLDMGYNTGASSWTHSHIITFNNGQRQIIRITNGRYRA